MSSLVRFSAIGFLAASLMLAWGAAFAASDGDIEAKTGEGRRVLLNPNGTWRYVEGDAAGEANYDGPQADLRLEKRIERGNNCRFEMRLVNNFPYEIKSLVPYYSAYKSNGVVYDSVSGASSFGFLKPGDTQMREVEFNGIPCKDIVRIQVVGGDRCDMGELDKFTTVKGQCLARVRVVESTIVRFDK
jgi:hypothetical protein